MSCKIYKIKSQVVFILTIKGLTFWCFFGIFVRNTMVKVIWKLHRTKKEEWATNNNSPAIISYLKNRFISNDITQINWRGAQCANNYRINSTNDWQRNLQNVYKRVAIFQLDKTTFQAKNFILLFWISEV